MIQTRRVRWSEHVAGVGDRYPRSVWIGQAEGERHRLENIDTNGRVLKLHLKSRVGECELDSSDPGQRPVAGFLGRVNESSSCMKFGKFHDQLSSCQFLQKECAPCNQLGLLVSQLTSQSVGQVAIYIHEYTEHFRASCVVYHVSFSLALKIICMTCIFSNMQELDFEKDVEPVGYFKLPPIMFLFPPRILTIIFSRYYF